MYSFFSKPLLAIVASCIAFASAADAQTNPSLREAVQAAWALSPQARALQNRQAELDARDRAAASLIAGPPSVGLAHRNDRVGRNGGLREYEFEVAAPYGQPELALPLRCARQGSIVARPLQTHTRAAPRCCLPGRCGEPSPRWEDQQSATRPRGLWHQVRPAGSARHGPEG